MKVSYSDKIRQSGELSSLAQQATNILQEAATSSASLATAEWDRGDDGNGRAVVTLRLSDPLASVSARFGREELTNPSAMHGRLLRLWGDLLEVRSHKQLQQLIEAVGARRGVEMPGRGW